MKKLTLSALLITLFAGVSGVANAADERVYLIDQRGEVVYNGTGICWRTGYWTPAAAELDPAGCQCDKDILPQSACAPVQPQAQAPVAEQRTPPVGVKPKSEKVSISADALFDFNKSTLRAEGKQKLEDLVTKTKSINLEVILVSGHADSIGSEKYNQKLSEKRANAVKDFLVTKGISAERVAASGHGESHSVTGDTCNSKKGFFKIECLQPDRRVEIEVIGTGQPDAKNASW